jgi:DNA-binding GntR family transcriptional regulator
MCDMAYAFLKRQIMVNELPPGSDIDERNLATRLGISRTPVREAVLRLRDEGFIQIRPRRGIRVLPIAVSDMREIYEILTALETSAVARLADRRPPRLELKVLDVAVQDMRRALKSKNHERLIDADERFHRGLLELCGNKRLMEAGIRYRDQIRRAHFVALRLRGAAADPVEMHGKLVDLIATGKVDEARANHLAQRIAAQAELMEEIERAGLTVL